jgi:hypothetical protein
MAQDFEFETEGQVRARLDWFDSFNDVDSPSVEEDGTSVWPFRANIGLTGSFNELFSAFIELQATGYFGDDFSGRQSYPGPSSGNVVLYQGYAMLDTDRWDFKFGRMEHQMGNELIIGNDSFYNGQVFDGVTANAEWDSWGLGLFLFKLEERDNLFPQSTGSSDDTNFYGADVHFNIGRSSLQPYLVYLRDDRNGAQRMNIQTVGALWKRPTVENKGFDWSAEYAQQFGETGTGGGEVDAKGYIFEGWFGWTIGKIGRFHVGALLASGDDAGVDNDGWVPLFEDDHAYNRLGDLDLFNAVFNPPNNTGAGSNIEDINAGWTWDRGDESKHGFFAAVHQFNRPEAVGDDDLGLEVDLTYAYDIVENSQLQIGAAYLSAGDLLPALTDDIMRFWIQIESSWGGAKPWSTIGQLPGWNN